jgi:pimeloyl-ACP methyl ester carboxylesterase
VLLTGLGNTAHIYDDFAPKLARGFHVLGITRRGFGESSAGSSGYSADRLADDVLAVVEHLQLRRPVLVGHSIAGEELSSVASRHPERIAGLVYLDAIWPYSFDDGTTGVNRGDLEALQRKLPAIGPATADLARPKALQQWVLRTSGVLEPEADFHHWAPSAQSVMQSVLGGEQRYSELRAPILALCAVPQNLGPPVERSHDPAVVAAREQWQVLKEKMLTAFERGVPSARVVRIPASHYLFISNQRQVLLQIRQFLSTLPP